MEQALLGKTCVPGALYHFGFFFAQHDLAKAKEGKTIVDQTEQFLTDLENLTSEEVRANFLDLFNQALSIEESEMAQSTDQSCDGNDAQT